MKRFLPLFLSFVSCCILFHKADAQTFGSDTIQTVDILPDLCTTGPCDGAITFTVTTSTSSTASQFTLLRFGVIENVDTSGHTPGVNKTFSGLCPGSYILEYFEGSTFMDTLAFEIDTSLGLTVSSTNTDIDCNNPTGSIDLMVSGGSGVFTYEWYRSGPSTFLGTSQDIAGLAAGNYNVVIRDSAFFGCAQGYTTTIANASFTPSYMLSSNPIPCVGGSGSAMVSFDTLSLTSFDSFSFTWNGPMGPLPDTTESISTNVSGEYFVSFDGMIGGTTYCFQDSVFITDSCGTISGLVFDDLNGNGIQDAGEMGMPGQVIQLSDGQQAVTDTFGNYSFNVGFGAFTVSGVAPISYYSCGGYFSDTANFSVPSGGSTTVFTSSTTPSVGNVDFGLNTGGPVCGVISGHLFDDLNNNGVEDAGEPGLAGVAINISGIGTVYSDMNGDYSVDVPVGQTYTISLSLGSGYYYYCYPSAGEQVQTFPSAPSDYSVSLTASSPVSANNDFGVFEAPFFDVGLYSVRTNYIVYPGSCGNAFMDFKSFGTIPDTCTLRLEFDPLITFNSAIIPPDVVGADFIEWHFTDATLPSAFYCMGMNFCLDSSATVGQTLEWRAYYTCQTSSLAGCADNDTMVRTWTVAPPVKSGIENDLQVMEVYHQGDEGTNEIEPGDSVLSYVINYQNYLDVEANHVTIINDLPDELDIATVSRPFGNDMDAKFCILDGNRLYWEMNTISLTDTATDVMSSYGFVQYNVFIKNDLAPGTEIVNQASVIFNHGESVVTNPVTVQLKNNSSVREERVEDVLSLYPNPTKESIQLTRDHSELPASLVITDIAGKVVFEGRLAQGVQSTVISVSHLSPGMYQVLYQDDKRASSLPLVIQE